MAKAKKISRSTCAAQHFGAWAIEPKWFRDAVSAVKSGAWKPVAFDDDALEQQSDDDSEKYTIVGGVAVIHVEGQITKHRSSFGGTSSIEARRALRQATEDSRVNSTFMIFDTPGGTVNGVADFADDVKKFGAIKPIYAFVDGLCCSAGYWVASQAKKVFASRTSGVGCIGVYTVLVDDTGAQDQMGVKYTLVSTGKYKGLGADGKVSDDMKEDVQREIDEINAQFKVSVSAGRGFDEKKTEDLADGRVHYGENALTLGLIDEVATIDVALQAVTTETDQMTLEQFNAFAKEHPEATKPFTDAGHAAGLAAGKADVVAAVKAAEVKAADDATKFERERCAALAKSFGDKPAFLADQISKGHDLPKAKAEGFDLLQAEAAEKKGKETPESDAGTKALGGKMLENKGPDGGQMTAERRAELLGSSSLGQTALNAK